MIFTSSRQWFGEVFVSCSNGQADEFDAASYSFWVPDEMRKKAGALSVVTLDIDSEITTGNSFVGVSFVYIYLDVWCLVTCERICGLLGTLVD